MCDVLCTNTFQAHILRVSQKAPFLAVQAGKQIQGGLSCQKHVDQRWWFSFQFWSHPAPKRSAIPIIKPKIQDCRTKLIICSFESSRREKQICGIHNTQLPKCWKKIHTQNEMTATVVLLSVNIFKSIGYKALCHI